MCFIVSTCSNFLLKMAETPVHVLESQVTQLKAQVEEVSDHLVSVPIPHLMDKCTYAVCMC